MGLDYIGPITPFARFGARSICISVCYFSRYLFAEPVPQATSFESEEFVNRRILGPFGWSWVFYNDNGSQMKKHFSGSDPKRADRQGPIRENA